MAIEFFYNLYFDVLSLQRCFSLSLENIKVPVCYVLSMDGGLYEVAFYQGLQLLFGKGALLNLPNTEKCK